MSRHEQRQWKAGAIPVSPEFRSNQNVNRISAELTEKHGVPFGYGDTRRAIELVSHELDDFGYDVPPEFDKCLKDVAKMIEADNRRTENEKARKAEEKARKKITMKAVTEEVANRESAIIAKVDGMTVTDLMAHYAEMFDFGQMNKCQVKEDAPDDVVVAMLKFSLLSNNWSQWAIGDLGIELNKRGLENVAQHVVELSGKSYPRVCNYIRVCEAVVPEKRDPAISYSIYETVYTTQFHPDPKTNGGIRRALMGRVENEKPSVVELRAWAKDAKGDDPPPKPPQEPEKQAQEPQKIAVGYFRYDMGEDSLYYLENSPDGIVLDSLAESGPVIKVTASNWFLKAEMFSQEAGWKDAVQDPSEITGDEEP